MSPVDTETALVGRVAAICADHARLEGPLLPILRAIQSEFGHLPDAVIPVIAGALNVSRAEVHGVISFYHDFRTEPAGRHVMRICRAEACQAMGAARLADAAKARLGVDWHGTTANGAVTLEPVYCLGLCACGPAAMMDDQVVGRVNDARLGKMLDEVGA